MGMNYREGKTTWLEDRYERLAASLWDYLEEQLPNDADSRDTIHEIVLHELDVRLRGAGVVNL